MSSKGKNKRNNLILDGKKHVVTIESKDDLHDKIVQVRKVVRNRSKADIALVLQSCEHMDNVVDAAIAKLIGPDKGQECLREWQVMTKKSKQKERKNKVSLSEDNIPDHAKENNRGEKKTNEPATRKEVAPLTLDIPDTSDSVSQPVNDDGLGSDDQRCPASSPLSEGVIQPSQPASPVYTPSPTKSIAERPNAEPATATIPKWKKKEPRPKLRRLPKKPRPPKRIREKLKMMAAAMEEAVGTEDAFEKIALSKDALEITSSSKMEPEASQQPLTIKETPESGISSGSNTSLNDTPPPPSKSVDEATISLATSYSSQKQSNGTSFDGSRYSSEPSLRKLIKDLHRTDISLTRHQQILQEQCDLSARNLERIFTTLKIGINARQEDLLRELRMVQQMASSLLQRRKATAITLRKLTESANQLDEGQIAELKRQLKYFVNDRKVDEAIGTVNRFYGDPDDLLPSVMKFGNIVGVQESYSSWNENPQEAVEKSATRVHMPPPHIQQNLPAPPSFMHPSYNVSQMQVLPFVPYVPPQNIPAVHHVIVPSMIAPGRIHINHKSPILPTPQYQLMIASSGHISTQVEPLNLYPRKYTPDQLAAIQERVRESLYRQGVCLYDPFTGKAIKPHLSCPPDLNAPGGTGMKKKTPTQQRRERKRRQKERERRQKQNTEKAEKDNTQLLNENKMLPTAQADVQDSIESKSDDNETAGTTTQNNREVKQPPPTGSCEELATQSNEQVKVKEEEEPLRQSKEPSVEVERVSSNEDMTSDAITSTDVGTVTQLSQSSNGNEVPTEST